MRIDPSQNRNRLEHEKAIRNALGPDEEILWWGRPRQGFLLRPVDAVLVPFLIIWVLMFNFVNSRSHHATAGILDRFSIVFFIAGVAYLAFGRYFIDWRVRSNTYYALTEKDAVIISGLFSRTIKRIGLKSISSVSFKEKNDKSGTVILGPTTFLQIFEVPGLPPMGGPAASSPCFDMIPDARAVYEIIQKQRA